MRRRKDYSSSKEVINSFLDDFQTKRWDAVRHDAVLGKWNGELESLLKLIAPCAASQKMRRSIVDFVRQLVVRTLRDSDETSAQMGTKLPAVQVAVVGSFATKTYLPDSDLDLTVLGDTNETCVYSKGTPRKESLGRDSGEDQLEISSGDDGEQKATRWERDKANKKKRAWYSRVNEALCQASDEGNHEIKTSPSSCVVRNVTFVNANVKLVKCVINNISVDISAGQRDSLLCSSLVESLDKVIGEEHLFKRSLLLIKSWCQCKYGSGRMWSYAKREASASARTNSALYVATR